MILHHHEGEPIPPGYRVEEGHLRGLALTGGLIAAGTYGLTALGTSVILATFGGGADETAVLLVPLVGPFIAISTLDFDDSIGITMMTMNGTTQIAGVLMMIAGLATSHDHLVPDVPQYNVTPLVGPNHGGIGVNGVF